jgi:hypothetical protein
VALGAGGFGVVSAAVSSGDRAIYVPVTPIRVLDTRSSEKVVNKTVRLVIEGVITTVDGVSRQVVPTDASAVAINITATSTRKNGDYGYVTVFPCTTDSDTAPNASSLNFENGVDIANALNVATSANGSICLYVFGTADLLVDVAGYYADHNHDDRYYSKADVDAALADKADSDDIDAALNGIDTALAGKADSVDVDVALADKADSDDVDAALNGIDTVLAGKANRCADVLICVVGDAGPGGGIVFYDAGSTQSWGRYLEVACAGWQNGCDGTTADPQYAWGCSGTPITGADGALIGTGEQNTTDIANPVGGCLESGIAARLAGDLVLGGQSDWFLPSSVELNVMFANRTIIGGFSGDDYWSSSEFAHATYAWNQNFDSGAQNIDGKTSRAYVRPVRAF